MDVKVTTLLFGLKILCYNHKFGLCWKRSKSGLSIFTFWGYLLFPILLWVAHKLVGWAISNVDGGMWTTNMLHWLNSVIEYDAHGCKLSWDAFS